MDAASESKTITISAPREFANRLRVVAAHRGITMLEAVEKYLSPALDREYRLAIKAADRELGGES